MTSYLFQGLGLGKTPLSGVNPRGFLSNLILYAEKLFEGHPGSPELILLHSGLDFDGATNNQVPSISHEYFRSNIIPEVHYHFSQGSAINNERGRQRGLGRWSFLFGAEF